MVIQSISLPERSIWNFGGVIHSLGISAESLSWARLSSGESSSAPFLGLGTRQGITLLSAINSKRWCLSRMVDIHVGSATLCLEVLEIRAGTFAVVSAHADNSIRLHLADFNNEKGAAIEQISVLSGTSGHISPVTCLSATVRSDVICSASADDNRTLIISSISLVTNEEFTNAISLKNIASELVFFPESNARVTALAVLEGSRISVYDCESGSWLLSVYSGSITSISTLLSPLGSPSLVSCDSKGWKVFKGIISLGADTASKLSGGSGYTVANDQGVFRSRDGYRLIPSHTFASGKLIVRITTGKNGSVTVYDVDSGDEFGTDYPLSLSRPNVIAADITANGGVVALAIGQELFVIPLSQNTPGDHSATGYEEESSEIYRERPRLML
ncbi:uncharacterized protein V1516DRAFT_218394 [Lipomyces oligophaga]|uniref:uncharacterized protein n=1 Tax=Lipomyces oligophaga TaxID=45792 RepID=UPI0034D011FC